MTFSEFLTLNGLPQLHTLVLPPNPHSTKYEIVGYEFRDDGEWAVVIVDDNYDCEIRWTFDQLRKCKVVSEQDIYTDLLMEQQEQM